MSEQKVRCVHVSTCVLFAPTLSSSVRHRKNSRNVRDQDLPTFEMSQDNSLYSRVATVDVAEEKLQNAPEHRHEETEESFSCAVDAFGQAVFLI